MSKPWDEKPLWWKCYLGTHHSVYLHAGKIIGHLGIDPFGYYDAAKLLPDYDKLRYENAMRDLTVYSARETSPPHYVLHAQAKKVLRVILGPAPDDPGYAAWWRGRLASVRLAREEGTEPEFAVEPPVPLPDEEPKPKAAPKKAKRPTKRKAG